MTQSITFHGAKGGQGTTVTAIATALVAAARVPTTLVVQDLEEAWSILGVRGPLQHLRVVEEESGRTGPVLALAAGDLVIRDAGVGYHRSDPGAQLLVLRGPCFIALKAATAREARFTGVVILAEEGRSLRESDVELALDIPVVATWKIDPAMARRVDAGLLHHNVPASLGRSIGLLLNQLLLATGETAR